MPNFEHISKLLRYYILLSSTTAASGHPTSSLSAADIMSVLYFNFFRYDFENPQNLANDRLIFSKGHATPLLYAMYKVAGKITEEELVQYRKAGSPLGGHPTPETPYIDVATGSLGMGLSYGLGMSLALKRHFSSTEELPKVYVLLGDGEMAEGQNWEAIQVASYYNASNLIGIIDVNRLAETGETMVGHNVDTYAKRIAAFGWNTVVIDGHNYSLIEQTLEDLKNYQDKPTMIIAKTIKGRGVSVVENQLNKHGKALKAEEFKNALEELEISISETHQTFEVHTPEHTKFTSPKTFNAESINLSFAEPTPTRKSYGMTLAALTKNQPDVIVMDGDLSDSTFSGLVEKETPEQFLNMFIAEQNMVSTAVGMSALGFKPFVSTFSAFMTRAYDQIRMASLSQANIVLCGSHGGVSVGEDGPSGMGLEDIAMIRPIINSTILYPSDPVSMTRIVELAYKNDNITYIRSTRTPVDKLYEEDEEFSIGGSKVLKQSENDSAVVVAAGITVHEAVKAFTMLQEDGINIRIIDLYSVKPIDTYTLHLASRESQGRIITVEDHSVHGGLGDAVTEAFTNYDGPLPQVLKLGVKTHPKSATPAQNLEQHGLSAPHIVKAVKSLL